MVNISIFRAAMYGFTKRSYNHVNNFTFAIVE